MRFALSMLPLVALVACASKDAPQAALPSAGGDCAALAKLVLPNTTITTVELAGDGTPTNTVMARLPAFCRVVATLRPSADSDIQMEVWLPAKGWNGKFLGTGNGGAAGSIGYGPLGEGVTRGYATVATDTGHQGGATDFSFAIGHPEKLVDNAWRAVHEMTVQGKAITKAYYSTAPKRAYWNACSTGGRQGLKEAQRFPTDYDAIIAGAPARAWPGLPGYSAMMEQIFANPASAMSPAKLSLVKEAAIKACDALDGVGDRVIQDPRRCSFDPGVLLCKGGDAADCLTQAQLDGVKKSYAGLVDPKTKEVLFPGLNPGGETAWTAGAKIGLGYFASVVHGEDKTWTIAKFDVATDIPLAAKLDGGLMDASQPDLSAYFRRGGKLLLYHGTTDGLIPTQSTIDLNSSFYRSKQMPSVIDASVRLFLAPGMDHCRGGEGPSNIDWLTALEQWDATDKAPETILASKALPSGDRRSRPLCVFPKVARYKGAGVADDAENWACEL